MIKTFLDVAAAWTALDVVLLAAWHLAHVQGRRPGSRVPAPVVAAPFLASSVLPQAPRASSPFSAGERRPGVAMRQGRLVVVRNV